MPELERTETVSIVPRGGPWPVPPLDPNLARLDRGAMVGRYVVLGLVGEGGMGVVYAGYDPELDRKVALKVLRPERAVSAADHARLLREAQAAARLSHANVVAVHDAGTFGDQVFIAMEYVEGRTLRDWLQEESRSWREIVSQFRLAGQGLAAAHAAGLVHRDFKPDNVLIGKDGRVRVADFGLARPADPGEEGAAPEAKPGMSPTHATAWGVLQGTPAYMSPEQLRKGAADARSDQFSFCVALYEALYGERPFAGEEPDEVAGAAERGEIQTPATPADTGRVPAWLRQILLRGLNADPEARYPSMNALLRELGRDPGVRRRRWLMAAVLVLSGGGLLVWGSALGGAQRVCSGAAQKLDGIWDGARQEAARAAFLGTRLPYAPTAWAAVEGSLRSYTDGWKTMHREACEATRVRGEQSEDLLDRRMYCLDQRLGEVDALVDLFTQADGQVVERSVAAARSLTGLAACVDVTALKARVAPPSDPDLRARVDQVRSAVAEVKAWTDAGKHPEAAAKAERVVALARRVGYRPIEAEALFRQAYVQDLVGELDEAEAAAFDALVSAQGSGDLQLAARSASQLAWTVGNGMGKPAEGDRWSRLAAAVAESLPGDDALHAELLRHRAVIRYAEGRYAEAAEIAHQSLALAERAYGPDHPQVASLYSNLGVFYNELGRNEQSIAASKRGLAIRRKLLPPDHPDLAKSYNTLGNAYADLRRNDEALDSFRRAYQIFLGRYGADHTMTPGVLNNIAILHKELGRWAEAEQEYRQVLDSYIRIHGPVHPAVGMAWANLGEVCMLQKRHAEALDAYRHALSVNEKTVGRDHPYVAFDLEGIGRTLLDTGHALEAVPVLERALKIRESGEIDPDLLANARFNLAQALWTSNHQRSLKLARMARDAYSESEGELRREVDAWLTARETSR